MRNRRNGLITAALAAIVSIAFASEENQLVPLVNAAPVTERLPPLVIDADSIGIQVTLNWVDEFRANMHGADKFDDFKIMLVNQETLKGIRFGEVQKIEFKYSDDWSYPMTIIRVTEKSTNWWFMAEDSDYPDNRATVSISPSGAIHGSFQVKGLGMFLIRQTGTLPYHIVYLATGIYQID